MLINPRNLKLAFNNFYKRTKTYPAGNHFTSLYYINHNSKMQTSITSFFKTKAPAKEEVQDENIAEDVDMIDGEQSPETPIKTRKRPLDDDDSDDEGNIVTANNNKRRVLSSAESTPVKNAESAKTSKTDAGGPTMMAGSTTIHDTKEVKTPSKARQLFDQKAAGGQSPLFNVELLVKKKISSGASALHENIGVSWFKALQSEFDKPYFKKLSTFVAEQRARNIVYPPPEQVFTWTHHHGIRETRVVIIGQDPYHGPNMAHGLSFSVQKGIAIPKSLANIYKELKDDVPNFKPPNHGNLVGWSKQGVLLLNACLTVNKGQANSHQGKGWEQFTDAVISWISKNVAHNCVFLLWGRFAQKKSTLIDKRHKILNSAHPSPFSADNGFFGCKHFSQTNAYFKTQKMPEIDWSAL